MSSVASSHIPLTFFPHVNILHYHGNFVMTKKSTLDFFGRNDAKAETPVLWLERRAESLASPRDEA